MNISLVLPCYNEERNIASAVRSTSAWMKKSAISGDIIVVNDGSTDGTAAVLDELAKEIANLRVIAHAPNRGYGAAVTAGCDAAESEFVGFMDSDGQFDPNDFDLLLPHLAEADFVTGRRRKRADPFRRRMIARVFGVLVLVLLGVYVRDINCAMKVFRRSLWPGIRPGIATGGVFNAELFYRLRLRGIAWVQISVPHYPRTAGAQTGGSPRVILRAIRELWTLRTTKGARKTSVQNEQWATGNEVS